MLSQRPKTFDELGIPIPYHTCPRSWFGRRALILSSWTSPFLLQSDGEVQWRHGLRHCYSRDICPRSGTLGMVVYTSLTALAQVFDSIVARSSRFLIYLCEFRGHDVLLYVLPSLGSCYAIFRTSHNADNSWTVVLFTRLPADLPSTLNSLLC